MLNFAGYIDILIAIGHLVAVILWPEKALELTGENEQMRVLVRIHPSLLYLVTIVIAAAFGVFGLYGLSAGNKIRKLPLLKPAVFIIATIYLLRGFAGLLFLLGGLKKWKTE